MVCALLCCAVHCRAAPPPRWVTVLGGSRLSSPARPLLTQASLLAPTCHSPAAAPLMYAGQLGVTPCSSPGRALGLLPVAETLGGSEGAAGASGALSFGLLSGLAPAGDGRETAAPLPLFVGGEHGAGAGIDWTAVFASHR